MSFGKTLDRVSHLPFGVKFSLVLFPYYAGDVATRLLWEDEYKQVFRGPGTKDGPSAVGK